MDTLPWVADVYKRDLKIENYFIGYLLHPYISMYSGRGCPAQCTSASGRRPSAATNTASARPQTSPTK